ncbi:MAG: redoxin domain-containing protein [Tumebacillaceae bacterium]
MSTQTSNLSKIITILVLFAASVGIIWAVVNFDKQEVVVLQAGQPAPDFTLNTLDGKTVKLSDYKGKVVMVNFWASWCEPCRQEMPDIEKVYETYKDQGLVILGVNINEKNVPVQGFVNQMGLKFPILMDHDSKVAVDLYRVKPIPTTFFVDKDGILRQTAEMPMTSSYMENTLAPLLGKQ